MSPRSAWHLQMARTSTLHMNQKVPLFLKLLQGDQNHRKHDQRTHKCRPHGCQPTCLTGAPKGTSPVPHYCLKPTVGQGFHTAPGPTGTAVPQVAPGADQMPSQQDQCICNIQTNRRYPSGLPRALRGPFPVSNERLAPAFGKVFHAAPGPTVTSIPQMAIRDYQIPPNPSVG